MQANKNDMSVRESQRVVFKSKPLDDIMAPEYFQLANENHFWCRRRFEALQSLADKILREATSVAEIGCGNGVLMRQIENAYALPVTGFDLHEGALRRNVSQSGPVYCYDIHERLKEFERKFDLILMFDVLEHIKDQDSFLQSAKFHLAANGYLLMNVPALQWLYSPYDQIQGHYRRYSIRSFESVAKQNGLEILKVSYWGAPLIPIAILRKLMLSLRKTGTATYASGFDPGSPARNEFLFNLSRLEILPQRWIGTSVMASLQLREGAE